MAFAHLHCHTEYSLLDGAIQIRRLVEQMSALSMTSCAITDHGTMHGCAEFYKEFCDAGLNPVLGIEAYVCQDMHDTTSRTRNHLILLAENNEGYFNLLSLASKAAIEGFYYKPRIDKQCLKDHAKGIIALSACIQGEIPQSFCTGGMDGLRKSIEEYKEIFDADHLYLEIQHNGLPEQEKINAALLEISESVGLHTVATNDCHFLMPEEYTAHEVLLCIQTKRPYDPNKKEGGLHSLPELWFKDEAAMLAHLPKDAIERAADIASRCHVSLSMGHHVFPVYSLPDGRDPKEEFERLCWEGLDKRIAAQDIPEDERERYAERLASEISGICSMGFAEYFLIVQEFITYAKDHGIPVGPGRGSAAGSLAAYCLRITNLNPLPYNLLFERFLNPERVSLPDIDVDFCERRREEVIRHMVETYGKDNVAQICTFGTMKAKTAIKDVGKVMGRPFVEMNALTAGMADISLTKNMEADPAFAEKMRANQDIYQSAIVLEGLVRHASVHAAGLVVSPDAMTHYSALMQKRGEKGGIPVTQYEAPWLEKLGLVKFDFLGLRTLTVLSDALEYIRESGETPPDIDKLAPFDDPNIWEMLSTGKTLGVFQVEGDGLTSYLKKLKPECFEDLIAMLALYRPGPLYSGMVDSFIKRKHGEEETDYFGLADKLQAVLEPTYGVVVYQEQVMQIARVLAGYTLGQADILRRAMGKKKPEEMAKQKSVFLAGCKENGIAESKAEEIFALLEKFAEYGFNKSHSAAYAQIAYQTAYVKYYYPTAFFAALMTSERGNTKKLEQIVVRMHAELGISVKLPEINLSRRDFTPVGRDTIVYGFTSFRGLKTAAIDEILSARKKGPFTSMLDFLLRISGKKLTKADLEILVQGGAMDAFMGGLSRRGLCEAAKDLYLNVSRKKTETTVGVIKNDLLSYMNTDEPVDTGVFGVACEKYRDVDDWSNEEKAVIEKNLYGMYCTVHPLDAWPVMSVSTLKRALYAFQNGIQEQDWILVHIIDVKRKLSKTNGKTFYVMQIEDLSQPERLNAYVWNNDVERITPVLTRVMNEDQCVCEVKGNFWQRDDDTLPAFVLREMRQAERAIQKAPVYCFDTRDGLDNRTSFGRMECESMPRLDMFDWNVYGDAESFHFTFRRM